MTVPALQINTFFRARWASPVKSNLKIQKALKGKEELKESKIEGWRGALFFGCHSYYIDFGSRSNIPAAAAKFSTMQLTERGTQVRSEV